MTGNLAASCIRQVRIVRKSAVGADGYFGAMAKRRRRHRADA
ncbi:hypothetical protein [Microcoleus sp. N3A4]